MNWQRFLRKCKAGVDIINAKAQPSFSQVGEDVIVHFLLRELRIDRPAYLDIGTNLPVAGNNTYFFYNKGFSGVCIEPDPELYQLIKKERPRDTVLNAGIGLQGDSSAPLYIFPHPFTGWNTFSRSEAKKREQESGIKIKEEKITPLKTINGVIAEYFERWPNFISIDVEGLDLEILRTLDFSKYQPEVICAETVEFNPNGPREKIGEIGAFLVEQGYFVFADTFVNTIFCRKDIFGALKHKQ